VSKVFLLIYRGNRWIGQRPCRWAPMGVFFFRVLTGEGLLGISSRPFRGLFVTEGWSLIPHCGSMPNKRLWTRRRPDVKKVKLSERSAVRHLAPLETEYLKEHMGIIEQLAMLQYDDGSVRQTGYLGIWTQGATWFVRVQDKDADASLTCEGRTLDEALDTLQLQLGSEGAPWEPNTRKKKKGS